jgi:hypothetical protein
MTTASADAPSAKPTRWLIAFRLARTAIDYIDHLAKEEGVVYRNGRPNRSEMIRNLLAYAVRHRPKGWRP